VVFRHIVKGLERKQ